MKNRRKEGKCITYKREAVKKIALSSFHDLNSLDKK